MIKSSKLYWSVFIIVAVGVGGFFYLQTDDGRQATDDGLQTAGGGQGSIVVEDLQSGKKVIKNEDVGYQIVVPEIFKSQPSLADTNFYTSNNECKLSVQEIRKETLTTLDSLVEIADIEKEFMTIIFERAEYLDDAKKKMIYTLETLETGLSKVYYEDLGEVIIAVSIFSPDSAHLCYDEVSRMTIGHFE